MADRNIYKIGINNLKYSVIFQGIYFLLSIVTVFILPKVMGVTYFGYWQVYLFYVSYINILCFGFNDGLYLRYGNYNYDQLPFEKLRSAMRIFLIIISLISIFLFSLSFLEKDINKIFAFCATSINLVILGINNTLLSVLQFTNRIKLYNFLIIANKALFVGSIVIIVLIKQVDFRIIIAADILTKLLLVGIGIYKLKELFFGKASVFFIGLKEYKDNLFTGIKLMVSYTISLLLMGIGRFIVERFLPIETYSVYSFAVTITTFILMFMAAFSISLYPLLKRVPEEKLPIYYVNLNKLICSLMFMLLIIYYPLCYLISSQFSSYVGLFEYFYLLTIITLIQSKMQFLINTYYKVLREEKAMLIVSLTSATIALAIIIPAFYYLRTVLSIVIGTTITLVLQCYASEIYLKKKMGIKTYWDIVLELLILTVFILGVLIMNQWLGFFIYIAFITGYLLLNRKVLIVYTKLIFQQLR
jgi:O-antigen/teichoic acid export membrane protein